MKIRYFTDCATLDEIKRRYKVLAMQFHPDRGGDTAVMQFINTEYESLTKYRRFGFQDQNEAEQKSYMKFPEIINQIIGFVGITIELCGNWIWVSGNTFRYKEQLKKAGFFYSPNKQTWYWRPDTIKSKVTKCMSMDYIRHRYGSDIISQGTFSNFLDDEIS